METQELNQRLVKQDVPGVRRRQFLGFEIELAVWQNGDGDVVHFRVMMLPNLVVDFHNNQGLPTGHGLLPRLRRKHFLTREVPGEDPLTLPDLKKATVDPSLELTTLRLVFEKLMANPPNTQKRTLGLVAHVLYEVLTTPNGILKHLDGKLEAGPDSTFIDPEAAQRFRDAADRKAKYHGVFGKLMSLLTDDDS